jgi:hypothetical protein
MDWKKLAQGAKVVIDKRGGTESVKKDAEELKNIAKGGGTVSEKVRAAAEALKQPGAPDQSGEAGESR